MLPVELLARHPRLAPRTHPFAPKSKPSSGVVTILQDLCSPKANQRSPKRALIASRQRMLSSLPFAWSPFHGSGSCRADCRMAGGLVHMDDGQIGVQKSSINTTTACSAACDTERRCFHTKE
jgi:hypothetical protein